MISKEASENLKPLAGFVLDHTVDLSNRARKDTKNLCDSPFSRGWAWLNQNFNAKLNAVKG
jgi:hypothetical protein